MSEQATRSGEPQRALEHPQMASEPNVQKRAPAGARAKSAASSSEREDGTSAQESLRADLRRLEHLFAEVEWPDRKQLVKARKRARERALDVVENTEPSADVRRVALVVAAVELLAGLQEPLAAAPEQAASLMERIGTEVGIPRMVLARGVLRAPELLTMAPVVAVGAQLTMLYALGPLRSVSLWNLDSNEQPVCVHHVGEGDPSRRTRQLAQRVLAREHEDQGEHGGTRTLLLGMAVGRWQQPLAALVATAKPWARDRARPFLVESLPMLGAVLEREILISSNAATERALVESSERKLTRLGFDLHDGPIQDVAMLAEDLRLFRDQLELLAGPLAKPKLMRGALRRPRKRSWWRSTRSCGACRAKCRLRRCCSTGRSSGRCETASRRLRRARGSSRSWCCAASSPRSRRLSRSRC